ncbi:hypothetical protein BDR06DRAFT_671115 [Suillus hirtellus]|nr:hypothetical protein BDR06DRAFT_671115 [Suillus hirtellus]
MFVVWIVVQSLLCGTNTMKFLWSNAVIADTQKLYSYRTFFELLPGICFIQLCYLLTYLNQHSESDWFLEKSSFPLNFSRLCKTVVRFVTGLLDKPAISSVSFIGIWT